MSSKRILITGGAGFIGHHLARHFLEMGMTVVIYDACLNFCSYSDSYYENVLARRISSLDGAQLLKGDVRDRSFLDTVLREHSPDVVIHLAAIPISKAANSFSEEAVQINVNGTANVLESIRSSGSATRFVFISSSFVYGDFRTSAADEEHPLNPIDVYGATKLAGEMLTRGFGSRFGIEYSIVRPSAVYGPGDSNRRVVQVMVENAIAGKPLVMHNGGASQLDFTHVTDTVSGIALAALHVGAKGETFNITRGEGRSICDLVAVLRARYPDLLVTDSSPDERRPERGGLDISKACTLLRYAPRYSLEAGVGAYIDSILAFDRSSRQK